MNVIVHDTRRCINKVDHVITDNVNCHGTKLYDNNTDKILTDKEQSHYTEWYINKEADMITILTKYSRTRNRATTPSGILIKKPMQANAKNQFMLVADLALNQYSLSVISSSLLLLLLRVSGPGWLYITVWGEYR